MKLVSIPVFANDADRAVVKMPGRYFPGSVIQGETLNTLCVSARRIRELADEIGHLELQKEANDLVNRLDERLRHYLEVLQRHGLKPPS
ncbi:hypothetical protein AYO47_06985 [Planctomyces sp. SCGC AG-212-M04]|nr:hypothetical protein AYO47_06985 [Planctomyces sp. SCGC AG-212-M04]